MVETTVGPLAVLSRRLRGQLPPSFTSLLSAIYSMGSYQEFLALVAEYLPDKMLEIKAGNSVEDRLVMFSKFFREQYFPLTDEDETWAEWAGDGYSPLIEGISIPYHGFEPNEAHEVDMLRTGMLLMGTVITPRLGYLDQDIATTWFESCAEHVQIDSLKRVVGRDWSLQDLHDALDDTPYVTVAWMSDYFANRTDNPFLDCHYEYPLNASWTREEVDWLTEEYKQSEIMWEKMFECVAWLEEDPDKHYNEMLDFVLPRLEALPARDEDVPAKPRTLAQIFGTEEGEND